MELIKRNVQNRVLKDGKPLDLKLFEWNKVTRTFKSEVDGLTLDFTGINNVNFDTKDNCLFSTGDNCTFNTGSDCTFKTGDNCVFTTYIFCTFDTGSDCTFNTGSDCTFDTGSNCTFDTNCNCLFHVGSNCTFDTDNNCTFVSFYSCNFQTGCDSVIVVNKSNKEIITPPTNIKLTTCPQYTPGYLIGNDYYVEGVKQDGKYMLADKILSKIISSKGKVFKVYKVYAYTEQNNFSTTPTYIVQDGDIFSHGETIKEAKESLIYKIGNRDTSVYDNLTIDSVVTKEEAIRMYRTITGACEYGVRNYVASLINVKDLYTVREIVELTNNWYGNKELRKFFTHEVKLNVG